MRELLFDNLVSEASPVPRYPKNDKVHVFLLYLISNIILTIKGCARHKSAKWPTESEKLPNDGIRGWIDPCEDLYDEQFERSEIGAIIAKTEIGRWMYDNLNLWKKQHEVLWNIEQLDGLIDEIESLISSSCENTTDYKDLALMLLKARKLVKDFYAE